ncbi:MAG: hypothetical protein P9M07_06160 [Candidatus Aceula meridiana]|nr:hypothetical protein [Candidatus Aceula meridiana]
MREMTIQNLTSKDKTRNEVLFCEAFEREGIRRALERRNTCKIINVLEFEDQAHAEDFLSRESKKCPPPETRIVHLFNSDLAKDEVIYKISGNQYVVLGNRLFALKVSHSLKKIVSIAK